MLRDEIYFFSYWIEFCGSKKGRNFVAKAKKGSFCMMIILHELNLNNWNFLIKKTEEFFFGNVKFIPKKNPNKQLLEINLISFFLLFKLPVLYEQIKLISIKILWKISMPLKSTDSIAILQKTICCELHMRMRNKRVAITRLLWIFQIKSNVNKWSRS